MRWRPLAASKPGRCIFTDSGQVPPLRTEHRSIYLSFVSHALAAASYFPNPGSVITGSGQVPPLRTEHPRMNRLFIGQASYKIREQGQSMAQGLVSRLEKAGAIQRIAA